MASDLSRPDLRHKLECKRWHFSSIFLVPSAEVLLRGTDMSLTTVFAAVAAMAVNFGWQRADDGYEYLVQLEPETLQLLHEGVEVPIDSHVPEGVQPIRRVRIVVGKAELPRAELTDAEEPRTGEAVERSAYWRPGDSAPQGDGRYPAQQPPAAPPSAIDTMVQPLRDVDNFVEQGFEKGVDGLEKTGQTLRNAVGNVGSGVHEHIQRGKDALFGSMPNNSYPSAGATAPPATATAPALGAAPSWQDTVSTPATGNGASLPGLPAPPPAATNSPTGSTPASTAPPVTESSDDDLLRFPPDPRAAESMTSTDSGSRMVPIESANSDASAARVPAWDPKWPEFPAQPVSSPSSGWPEPTSPATASKSPPAGQPNASTDKAHPQTQEPASGHTPATNPSTNAGSLGGWALAIIGLAGSVGCNFFLGFSYLDIRNKYRAALRRTSRSFGRPAASA